MATGTYPKNDPLLQLPLGKYAFFLDFDGTLTDIVPQPDQVRVDPRLPEALASLQDATQGALAIVSGRAISTLDYFLKPLTFAAAGIHGAEYRLDDGVLHRVEVDQALLSQAKQAAEDFAQAHPGVLYEEKSLSLALHYRQAEALAPEVERFMTQLHDELAPAYDLQRGKMVFELKPRGCHKGAIIARFMEQAPFRGRIPLYAGDDVTDEDAFTTVNGLNGLSIKVGAGDTCARERLASPGDVVEWLLQLVQTQAQTKAQAQSSQPAPSNPGTRSPL